MGFMSFLLSRDMLGHDLSITYKGETTFNTKLGAFLSIAVQVLVLIQLIQLTIDMLQMNDPTILSYNRPLYEEEVSELGQINLNEFRLNFGVFLSSANDFFEPVEIPVGVGRIVTELFEFGPKDTNYISPTSCSELFNYVNMDLTGKSINAKQWGSCLDPD